MHGQRVAQPALDDGGQRLPRRLELSRLQVHPEREPNEGRDRELVLHDVEVQILGYGERLVRGYLVRVLQCFERRLDGVIDVGRGPLRHASSGESRVVALDAERRGDAEGEHQQHRDDGAASHPETSHGMKNPS